MSGFRAARYAPAMATDEEGIRRTLAQYAQLCDEGRFEEWADLFAADARFHVMGTTYDGRAAITGFISAAMPPEARGKHAILASVIDVGNAVASAWTDYLFATRKGQITSVGRYHDELERGDDGRWRFTLREIVFIGGQPQLAQPLPG